MPPRATPPAPVVPQRAASFLARYAARNVLRRRERTLLTTAAIALAVALLLVGHTLLDGFVAQVVGEFARTAGHVRLRDPRYERESRFDPLAYGIHGRRVLAARVAAVPGVVAVLPRLHLRAMLQHTDESTIVPPQAVEDEATLTDEQIFGRQKLEFAALVALDPTLERARSDVAQRLVRGAYFGAQGAAEVLVGVELAQRLGVGPGDTLQLVAWRGGVADASVRVAGVFDYGNRYANRVAYVPLPVAERLLAQGDEVTELLVFGARPADSGRLAEALRAAGVATGLELREWREIGVFRVILQVFTVVVSLLLAMILVVAGSAVLNTMFMTVLERQREIGVLLALGLGRGGVVAAVMLETFVYAVAGGALGLAAGLAGSLYLVRHGIDLGRGTTRNTPLVIGDTLHGELTARGVATALAVGFGVALLGALWPALRAASLSPVEAMRKHG